MPDVPPVVVPVVVILTAPGPSSYALMPAPLSPVVVPVVSMVSAPDPELIALMPVIPPVVVAALIVRSPVLLALLSA